MQLFKQMFDYAILIHLFTFDINQCFGVESLNVIHVNFIEKIETEYIIESIYDKFFFKQIMKSLCFNQL